MKSSSQLTQSIGTKVTSEHEQQIKDFCAARNADVSTMTRQLWLETLGRIGPSRSLFLSVYSVELGEKILSALATGDGKEFVAKFREWFERNSEALIAKRIGSLESE